MLVKCVDWKESSAEKGRTEEGEIRKTGEVDAVRREGVMGVAGVVGEGHNGCERKGRGGRRT